MKKLLLAGIMSLATVSFATGLESNEATVDILAKVVQPLEITTTPLNYGLVVAGQEKWADEPGVITITGTAGENIKVLVKTSESEKYEPNLGPRHFYDVTLTREGGNGDAENEKLETKLTLQTRGIIGDQPENGIWVIESDNGQKEFTVNGPVTSKKNQKSGNYKGQIYVKAMYQ